MRVHARACHSIYSIAQCEHRFNGNYLAWCTFFFLFAIALAVAVAISKFAIDWCSGFVTHIHSSMYIYVICHINKCFQCTQYTCINWIFIDRIFCTVYWRDYCSGMLWNSHSQKSIKDMNMGGYNSSKLRTIYSNKCISVVITTFFFCSRLW